MNNEKIIKKKCSTCGYFDKNRIKKVCKTCEKFSEWKLKVKLICHFCKKEIKLNTLRIRPLDVPIISKKLFHVECLKELRERGLKE